jgi:ABC-type transport system involved in multi-copper enzyme maturation permease subunit
MRLFIFLSLLPVLLVLLIKIVDFFSPGLFTNVKYFLGEMSVQIFFLFNVQLFALFFGSGVISEEVDERTLSFLVTRPVSKNSILAGKTWANLSLALVPTLGGIILSFTVYLLLAQFVIPFYFHIRLLSLLVYLGLLHLVAYGSLFTLLGVWLRRPLITGIIFVYGWENIVHHLPGKSAMLTLSYYLRPLLPSFNYSSMSRYLESRIQEPDPLMASITLTVLSILFFASAMFIFRKKEYRY